MNKLMKAKLVVFSVMFLTASISYIYHLLPYKAIWLWFPVLVFINHWLNWYAKKRGMILSDEMTKQTVGKAAWATFQATVVIIFLTIVYHDYNPAHTDPRYTLAYVVGFMGIVFLATNAYYSIKQGMWD